MLQVLVGDNAFRASVMSVRRDAEGNYEPPEVVRQHQMENKPGSTWAGMIQVQGYVLTSHVCPLGLADNGTDSLAAT